MNENKFEEVIQFAIKKEIGSVNFYSRASEMAKYPGTKELFLELAEEENGHRKLLEDLTMGKVAEARIESIPDLKISDYMVDVEFRPDISYADIIRMSMKSEEASLKMYNDLKKGIQDEQLKKLFSFLAQEEAKHKLKFEKIYDDEILR